MFSESKICRRSVLSDEVDDQIFVLFGPFKRDHVSAGIPDHEVLEVGFHVLYARPDDHQILLSVHHQDLDNATSTSAFILGTSMSLFARASIRSR
jgi:hypothetical protein